ncbi:MAG: hypothetical protein LC750_08980 [Actinobacteria bacterium]|nr:hypothetical protein [Actinomycetota bacterium]
MSPLRGYLIGDAADDGSSTYAIMQISSSIDLIKRGHDGSYTRVAALAPAGTFVDVSLLATRRGWWAVWSDGHELFEARAETGRVVRQQITFSRTPDEYPSLAAQPNGMPLLVWMHVNYYDNDTGRYVGEENEELRVATPSRTGWRSARFAPALAKHTRLPDVWAADGATRVASSEIENGVVLAVETASHSGRYRRYRFDSADCPIATYPRVVGAETYKLWRGSAGTVRRHPARCE